MKLEHTQWPEYRVWAAMKSRCKNPRDSNFKRYGARGIDVCEEWKLFNNFIQDMGRRPSDKHSIDRVNVNGNYEPGNCRWATLTQQALNQRLRIDNTSGYKGVSLNYKKWTPYVFYQGTTYPFGSYRTAEEAAYIYDQVMLQLYGLDARLNIL